MPEAREQSPSQSYFWPTVLAVGLHVLIFALLFVSFQMTEELPPSKPVIQATLYQLKSQSQATTQTNQKIAGEAKRTAARQHETEQLEQRKLEEQKQAVARAEEQKKAEEARKAEQAEAAAEKAAAEKAAAEKAAAEKAAAAAEQKREQAEIARKKAEEEAKQKAAEEAKKKAAAEDAKKKAAEEAKKKAAAAEEARKKAAAEAKKKAAAEDAKKKQAEAARKAAEDRKAQALAELLSENTERQQAMADTQGDQVSGSLDDLIRLRAAQGWTRPPSARNGMSVALTVSMLPDGTITNVSVSRSSGDAPFDNSALAAVRNIGRLSEMQQLSPSEFNQYRSFTITFTPEDLAL